MSEKHSVKRAKPLVAFANQQSALGNIRNKIDFLEKVCLDVSTGKPKEAAAQVELLAALFKLPTTIRAFNIFERSQIPAPLQKWATDFRRNAPATLRADKDLTSKVTAVLKSVMQLSKLSKAEPKRDSTIAGLRRALLLANSLREISEATIFTQKRSFTALENRYLALQRKYAALERESAQGRLALERELAKGGGIASHNKRSSTVVSILDGKQKDES